MGKRVDDPLEAALQDLRRCGLGFADAAGPRLEAALRRSLERLMAGEVDRLETRGAEAVAAFRTSCERAIREGVAQVEERLRSDDLLTSPTTVPLSAGPEPEGWSDWVPAWLSEFLDRWAARRDVPHEMLGELDDPANRLWIAMLNAADGLDPVLEGFGLRRSEFPDPGGGHFHVQPRTIGELDPDGALRRLWAEYRLAYGRYARLAAASSR